MWELNPGPLGEKRERYLCAIRPLLPPRTKIHSTCTSVDSQNELDEILSSANWQPTAWSQLKYLKYRIKDFKEASCELRQLRTTSETTPSTKNYVSWRFFFFSLQVRWRKNWVVFFLLLQMSSKGSFSGLFLPSSATPPAPPPVFAARCESNKISFSCRIKKACFAEIWDEFNK